MTSRKKKESKRESPSRASRRKESRIRTWWNRPRPWVALPFLVAAAAIWVAATVLNPSGIGLYVAPVAIVALVMAAFMEVLASRKLAALEREAANGLYLMTTSGPREELPPVPEPEAPQPKMPKMPQ